ncbi:MAG: bifunctional 5,10-methylenetetrahydrofolate dehydrogenase/5,10-methenyltetrahydrofolate cyclohydrolase [Peptostreptococcaceae bacterium]|nr:bifunctional 5,10-methylenetetrahydrofolate dehydrogenase/5,10-methenyltetrahydrofolate cyclohydrolase [Peptostreptococcaceae bacterium]
MDKLLLGKNVADKLKQEVREKVEVLKARAIEPKLSIVRVGEKPDDIAYQKGATKTMEDLGIAVEVIELAQETTTEQLAEVIEKLNKDDKVHGVLMLRPLPAHINENKIRNLLVLEKDIDCMSELALAGVLEPKQALKKPCTPQAVIEILKHYNIEMSGKNAVVLGRSTVIGKPVALLLTDENATVTLCHSRTKDLAEVCRNADILVSAIGKAKFVTKDFVKDGTVVIDVGINFDEEGKMVGDVDMDAVMDQVSGITPVPRGVGSVTTTVLAMNLINGIK